MSITQGEIMDAAPFAVPEHAIALDITGNVFTIESTGPMFVYPLAHNLKQAQHLHSLWLKWRDAHFHYVKSSVIAELEDDYNRAREIIALANRIADDEND